MLSIFQIAKLLPLLFAFLYSQGVVFLAILIGSVYYNEYLIPILSYLFYSVCKPYIELIINNFFSFLIVHLVLYLLYVSYILVYCQEVIHGFADIPDSTDEDPLPGTEGPNYYHQPSAYASLFANNLNDHYTTILRLQFRALEMISSNEIEELSKLVDMGVSYKDQLCKMLVFLDKKPHGRQMLISALNSLGREHPNSWYGYFKERVEKNNPDPDTNDISLDLPPVKSLPGFNTLASETFISSASGKHKWNEYGLTINVHGGLVQASVSLEGQVQLPQGKELVSLLYLITVNQVKILTAEISHCAILTSPRDVADLNIVMARVPDMPQLPYKMAVTEVGTAFSCNSSYGTIKLPLESSRGHSYNARESFLLAVVKPQRTGMFVHEVYCKYCAKVFYESISSNLREWKVHIVIFKDLKSCNQIVMEEFPTDQFFYVPDSDCKLCIKESGVTIKIPETQNGWTISALSELTISRQQINTHTNYSQGNLPRITLNLTWTSDFDSIQNNDSYVPPNVSCQLKVKGTRGPHKCSFIKLDLRPESIYRGFGFNTQDSQPQLPNVDQKPNILLDIFEEMRKRINKLVKSSYDVSVPCAYV